jgi:hypothetical protein
MGRDCLQTRWAASQSPKAGKIAAYCRRVLVDAARAAIRSASTNRLRSSSGEGTGGGEGERMAVDAPAPAGGDELSVDDFDLGICDRGERAGAGSSRWRTSEIVHLGSR